MFNYYAPSPIFTAAPTNNWTKTQDDLLKSGLENFSEQMHLRWELIALQVPGKTVQEVINRAQELLGSNSELIESQKSKAECKYLKVMKHHESRKKPEKWNEDEHRQFLAGVEKYGKGQWKNIAMHFVKTRTPSQVASHAQKYFAKK